MISSLSNTFPRLYFLLILLPIFKRRYTYRPNHPLASRVTLSGNPRRRNISDASKCIEILRCDPRIQYKGFYRLTLPGQKQPMPPLHPSSPLPTPVFTVSFSPLVASRAPSSERPTRIFVPTRTQFTMELLQQAILYNAPNNASMQRFRYA